MKNIKSIWSWIETHWKIATFLGNIIAIIVIAGIVVVAIDMPKSSLYFAYVHQDDLKAISSHLQKTYESQGSTGLQEEENKILKN